VYRHCVVIDESTGVCGTLLLLAAGCWLLVVMTI